MKRPSLSALKPRNLPTLFTEFFESERSSGMFLMACTVAALLIANSPAAEAYGQLLHLKLGIDLPMIHLRYDLQHWINDGLMAVFFLLIGLEIERELYVGELSDIRNASLPIFAALGGMLAPALIYLLINRGGSLQGFGIPMATDIAFALGVLALAGNRIPVSLKVFLTAFAIIDDLGAIMVITLFYSQPAALSYLGLAAVIFIVLLLGNRMKVRHLGFYLPLGLLMWYAILQSGVHAAISGVLLAFAIPFENGRDSSPSYRLQHLLHKPVAFLIMPLFALANTGIALSGIAMDQLITGNTAGIFFGLLVGKPLGIVLFSLLAAGLGISQLPAGVTRWHILGVGFLGGIGFTMAIFITVLAFQDAGAAAGSKLAILLGSLLSGVAGLGILMYAGRQAEAGIPEPVD